MSKPSKEVIELSRRLHDLGVRKEPEVGDWEVYDWLPGNRTGPPSLYLIEHEAHIAQFNQSITRTHFIIPPLEWCLEWLRERGLVSVESQSKNPVWAGVWIPVDRENIKEWKCAEADTPYLAILKAMVAVKEAGND